MKIGDMPVATAPVALDELFEPVGADEGETVVSTSVCTRVRLSSAAGRVVLRDEFAVLPGLSCAFVRVEDRGSPQLTFAADGAFRMVSCALGGWLLESVDQARDSYWIPRQAMLRSFDAHRRVLVEEQAEVTAFRTAGERPEGKFA